MKLENLVIQLKNIAGKSGVYTIMNAMPGTYKIVAFEMIASLGKDTVKYLTKKKG